MKIKSENLKDTYERHDPIREHNSHRKTFEELNLMDSFLFESATEKPENAVLLSKVIIERTLGRKVQNLVVQPQKDLKGININSRGIRMDIYTMEMGTGSKQDEVTCVYDIEPNNYRDDLPQRNRYYQSLIDSKLLPTNSNYKNLPSMVSIWILPYDPFGDDRMIYTVKNAVAENDQIVYNDGVTKVFLYTHGKIGGSDSLKALLDFMENTNRSHAVDEELSKIMNVVDSVKSSPEEKKRYMGIMGMFEYEIRDAKLEARQEALQEGHQAGLREGRQEGLREGHQAGLREGKIAGFIRAYHSLNIDKEIIRAKIKEQFLLDEEQAEQYLTLYWNDSPKTNS